MPAKGAVEGPSSPGGARPGTLAQMEPADELDVPSATGGEASGPARGIGAISPESDALPHLKTCTCPCQQIFEA